MQVNGKTLIAIAIVVLVGLSSTRTLDDYVDDYTSEAITNAAISYATARGINALVSMLQSSEVEAGVGIVSGSMTIGEVLDPLNDMIERFSTVMTWVLASLAAQKILLLLASHQLFLYLVAVLGISALLLLYHGRSRAQSLVLRCFLVVVFLRFALGFAVALNSGVDYLFLDQQLHSNDREIKNFQSSIMRVEVDADSDDIRDSVIDFWRGLSLDELQRTISRGIESFINLIAIYLLKTILLPLGFFYAVILVIRQLWRIDLEASAARAGS
ncbi:MAG: hypothetical protein GY815_00150 [Gammaproteobacteria bacterium]|nr:hypothetical protein [Gammaproteobacteria bacterium]